MTVINMPYELCPSSAVMSIRRVVGRTISPYTLEEQSFKWPGEQWGAEITLPPIKDKEVANAWKAFFVKLKGSYGMFYFGDPSAKTPLGVATGTPVVQGGNQTGNTLVTDGWTNNITGILKAGDYIQIGTGAASKLHMVVEDANSDGSGVANLTIEPALRNSPADNTPITVTNAKGVFRLANNEFSWSVSPGSIYRISFEAVEVASA